MATAVRVSSTRVRGAGGVGGGGGGPALGGLEALGARSDRAPPVTLRALALALAAEGWGAGGDGDIARARELPALDRRMTASSGGGRSGRRDVVIESCGMLVGGSTMV